MPTYVNRVFPHQVGGPGPIETVVLTVTAAGSPSATNPVLAQTDLAAYNAATDLNKARHDRFSDIVEFFSRYSTPISVASDGDQTITLTYEHDTLHKNKTEGTPKWFDRGHRDNLFDMMAEYVANDSHGVTAITGTCDGTTMDDTND